MSQQDLFAADPPPVRSVGRGDPDRVRARLTAILGEAEAANEMPWDAPTLKLYRTIVPQMSRWLPDAERAVILAAFDAELTRLGA